MGHDGLIQVNRLGGEIAPLGSFTDDFAWRVAMKPGDLIDCLDSEGVWYKSTVLEERLTKPILSSNEAVKEVNVGYRYYSEEEGHKSDEVGKYVGWSNKYDSWHTVSSP